MPSVEARLLARPLYMQVRDVLVHRIAEGNWKPGASLPNETLLAQELGISIGTVRKALDIMEDERIVTRRQGRGTFVSDFSTQPHLFSSFFKRDGAPVIPEKRRKSVSRICANEEVASRLGLKINDEVIEMERVHFHGQKPFLTEIARFPAHLFKTLPEDITRYRISVLAQHNGIIVGYAEEVVTAAPASATDAIDLEVPEKTPLICLDRIVYSDRGEPLEWRLARSFTRHERFVVRYQ
ncbi:GntR family transcriptional regulator [uncultured Hyphomicrobium sp.]|uniref:GntR family transcriptional regulator n=1 Tax=uncultured Hyphomicrobium sp. TaxID=194373 RepID=UPI0026013278|nr:GntR family transcriptional regulator [uncultured Hyphomicrobium sp.]